MSKIRTAMVSCGNIQAKHYKEILLRDDVEMVGVMDVNPDQAERLFTRSGVPTDQCPQVFTSTKQMYGQTKPDAVIIASPHTMHYEHCLEAIDHGCHIMIEKPMVTHVDHAVDLKSKVEAAGKVFTIAYNTPCSQEFDFIRNAIRSKRFGDLKVVTMFVSQPWKRLAAGKWRMDPALSGGGFAYDTGAHVLNSLTWTLERDIDWVMADLDYSGTKVDINAGIMVKFVNGVVANIGMCGESAQTSHAAWMFTNGFIRANPWLDEPLSYSGDIWPERYPVVEGVDSTPLNNFIDSIQGKDQPRTSVDDGLRQSRLMDAVYRSADSGKPEKPSA